MASKKKVNSVNRHNFKIKWLFTVVDSALKQLNSLSIYGKATTKFRQDYSLVFFSTASARLP